MSENTKGEWVKYEKQPGKWKSTDSSYTRLCNDLEEHKDTGWDLDTFEDYIYGEFLPYDGTPTSDIYVYYANEKSGKRKPELFLAVYKDNDGINVDVFGKEKKTKSHLSSFEPDAKYLSILLEKLQELNAKESIIEEYKRRLIEYQDLVRISKDGIETSKDILAIYRNLSRTDTTIASILIKGRNIQADYDSLNEEDKIAFIKIICSMYSEVKEKLVLLTNSKSPILKVTEINILKETVSITDLLCLYLAPEEYRKNKEIMLEILSDFDVKVSSLLGLNAISEDLQIDIDIIQALIRTHPCRIKDILTNYNLNNKLFEERLNDKNYMLRLLDIYLKSVISNYSYIKDKYIPLDLLWFFRLDYLDNIENKVVYGPFETSEEEEMKQEAYNQIKLERTRIKEYWKKQSK